MHGVPSKYSTHICLMRKCHFQVNFVSLLLDSPFIIRFLVPFSLEYQVLCLLSKSCLFLLSFYPFHAIEWICFLKMRENNWLDMF